MKDETQKFKIDFDAPCGRANYAGGRIELHAGRKVFTTVDALLTNFRTLKLEDGDQVEITVKVVKRNA